MNAGFGRASTKRKFKEYTVLNLRDSTFNLFHRMQKDLGRWRECSTAQRFDGVLQFMLRGGEIGDKHAGRRKLEIAIDNEGAV